MKRFYRAYLIPMALVLIFTAPGILAYVFYQHPAWYLRATKTNKGTLLAPPLLVSPSKKSAKWRMLFWSPQVCSATCMAHLEQLARVRLAFGRRLYDIEVGVLLKAEAPVLSAANAALLKQADIRVFRLDRSMLQGSLPPVSRIYLENPSGYLILAYSPKTASSDIFYDMKHLFNTKG